MQSGEKPAEPKRRWFSWPRLLILMAVLSFIGLATFWAVLSAGCPSVGHLVHSNPKSTAMIELRKRQGRLPKEYPALTASWIPIEQLPEKLQRTIVVAEDCGFYGHQGVDWHEVREAARKNYQRGKIVRGASTISQQLAKNLFLSPKRTWTRKLREFIIVGRMESVLSKQRILELYLNCIEYGPGVFGIGRAASRFFGTSAPGLSLSQMVRLAAVLPAPRRLNPNRPSPELERRSRMILRRLHRFGYIAEDEFLQTSGSLDGFFGSAKAE